MSTAKSSVRIAIVTGAAQGMGESIALRLAEDGLDVAVNDVPTKLEQLAAVVKQIETKGRRAIAVPGDVRSEKDVKALVEKTVETFGSLDVMVANAGVMLLKAVLDTTTEDTDFVYSVNVNGVFWCFKYAALQMIKQGRGGRIIGASSTAGKRGQANMAAYSGSKFAVRGIIQSCASEWAQHKITVNGYSPGAILTPMVLHPDDAINGGPASTAMKYIGMPLDTPHAEPSVIASLVSYLAKPESFFVTGQCINVDGGLRYD
ncbi:NAD-P-binding protein [Sparassis latifolia]